MRALLTFVLATASLFAQAPAAPCGDCYANAVVGVYGVQQVDVSFVAVHGGKCKRIESQCQPDADQGCRGSTSVSVLLPAGTAIVQEILGQLVVVDLVILPTVYTFSYEGVAPCGQQLDESWMFMNSTGIFGSVEVGVRCGSCPQ